MPSSIKDGQKRDEYIKKLFVKNKKKNTYNALN